MLLLTAVFTLRVVLYGGASLPYPTLAALTLVFPPVWAACILMRSLFEGLTADSDIGLRGELALPGMSRWWRLTLVPGTIAGFMAC